MKLFVLGPKYLLRSSFDRIKSQPNHSNNKAFLALAIIKVLRDSLIRKTRFHVQSLHIEFLNQSAKPIKFIGLPQRWFLFRIRIFSQLSYNAPHTFCAKNVILILKIQQTSSKTKTTFSRLNITLNAIFTYVFTFLANFALPISSTKCFISTLRETFFIILKAMGVDIICLILVGKGWLRGVAIE